MLHTETFAFQAQEQLSVTHTYTDLHWIQRLNAAYFDRVKLSTSLK